MQCTTHRTWHSNLHLNAEEPNPDEKKTLFKSLAALELLGYSLSPIVLPVFSASEI